MEEICQNVAPLSINVPELLGLKTSILSTPFLVAMIRLGQETEACKTQAWFCKAGYEKLLGTVH